MVARCTPLEGQHPAARPAFLPSLDDTELARAAQTDACVLFTGASHVRTLALRIHSLSGWRWGPFVAVDCAAAENVLDQQLFRVLEADAWPSDQKEAGVRLLQPGTIFLHEVGALNAASQARLRDLLAGPACSPHPRPSRRRIMASTTEPLLPRVAAGSFDDCLFYRLNVIQFWL